jgi:hypothetical protein
MYRLLNNTRMEADAPRQTHFQATRERVVGQKRILAIQDTTELNDTS